MVAYSRSAVPKLFINRAYFGDKMFRRAYFGIENKNIRQICFLKDVKGTFSIQITFCKGPAGILKSCGGQKNARRH
jgi:hypothetical protein